MSTEVIEPIEYPVSIYPSSLKSDIYKYELKNLPQGKIIINDELYIPPDFGRDYEEQYLVYDYYGGGSVSVYFLMRIKLHETLRLHIVNVINGLGIYAAVNIRHTDFQTDYKPFLQTVIDELTHDKIVLCTDSFEVQQYCIGKFGDKLIIPTEAPDLGGKPFVAKTPDDDTRSMLNTKAFTDLFILACSDKLCIASLTYESFAKYQNRKVKSAVNYSGFSVLAMNLHKRKRLVKRLLSG